MSVIDEIYQQYISSEDQVLLDTIFAKKPTQKLLDDCLKVCDIEIMGSYKSLMFSYFMLEYPEIKFPAHLAPRLKGLIDYFKFSNLNVISNFSRIIKVFNNADIPVVLFKGMAMKVLRPNLSRAMGDADILIPEKNIKKAIEICLELGYDVERSGKHAYCVRTKDGKDVLDIHHVIFNPYDEGIVGKKYSETLFTRATKHTAFGVDVLLPPYEDLLFITLVNLSRSIRRPPDYNHSLYYTLYDYLFLLKDNKNFDFSIVSRNIKITKTKKQVTFALDFMEKLVPGITSDFRKQILLKKNDNFYNLILYEAKYVKPLKKTCQAIYVFELRRHPWRYGKLILKFLFLKKLRHFPFCVRWYLRNNEKGEYIAG